MYGLCWFGPKYVYMLSPPSWPLLAQGARRGFGGATFTPPHRAWLFRHGGTPALWLLSRRLGAISCHGPRAMAGLCPGHRGLGRASGGSLAAHMHTDIKTSTSSVSSRPARLGAAARGRRSCVRPPHLRPMSPRAHGHEGPWAPWKCIIGIRGAQGPWTRGSPLGTRTVPRG